MSINKGNIVYISHGGGPMPLLGDAHHLEMIEALKVISQKVGKPSAILVISAHWESSVATITSAQLPQLIYDYYGFPKQTYEIQYPCKGLPELATSVFDALSSAGIQANLNNNRGLDHGVFVPLKIMYPDADIPCVQLSLVDSLDPEQHIAIGKALQNIDWDNLLVLGSGFSFHNMPAFYANEQSAHEKNITFEQWLKATMTDNHIPEQQRTHQLVNWELAPFARFCHPREEHLLPLHICYGMAGRASDTVLNAKILNMQSSMFLWEQSS